MIVEASNVTVLFRRGFKRTLRALDGFSVRVAEGDIFGLLGPNGAGKSTAMHCCLGLLQPDGGEVRVLGERPVLGAPLFNDVIYLPEEPHYHLYLTVFEAVQYYARLYRRTLDDTHVRTAIASVGLGEFRDLRMAKCSKGMKQKVGLAVCQLFKPRLLFMDEPTRGLDPVMVRGFRDYLVSANRAGTTVVLNSHVLSEVELVCNRVAIVDHGRVLAQDALAKLIRTQQDTYDVALEGEADPPPFLTEAHRGAGMLTGTVSAAGLPDLMQFVQAGSLRLLHCRLRRETLEDVYLRVIRADGTGVAPAAPPVPDPFAVGQGGEV
jgi:ABC-2 type transport system ATP-binding protein